MGVNLPRESVLSCHFRHSRLQPCSLRQRQWRSTSHQRQPFPTWHQFQPCSSACARSGVHRARSFVVPSSSVNFSPSPIGDAWSRMRTHSRPQVGVSELLGELFNRCAWPKEIVHHLSSVVTRSSIVGKLRSGAVTMPGAKVTEDGWVGEGSV